MIRVVLFLALFMVCSPLPSYAQEEEQQTQDSRLSKSSDGLLQSKKHHDKLEKLLARYHGTLERSAEQFEQAAAVNMKRYEVNIDRLVRQQTQEGDINVAADLSTLLFEVTELDVSLPNTEGEHFLSLINLTQTANDDANRYGRELNKLVADSAESYGKQIDRAFRDYADQVESAREDYCSALRAVITTEHRAANLEGYRQVRDEIQRVTALSRPQREAEDTPQDDVDFFGQSLEIDATGQACRGFFIAEYQKPNGQPKFRYMIELTADGGQLHATAWGAVPGKWQPLTQDITITEQSAGRIVFHHKTQNGATAVHHLTLKDGWPVSDELWWNQKQLSAGKTSERAVVHSLGTAASDLRDLPEGDLYVDVLSKRGLDGKPQSRKGKYRLRINNGVIAMVGIKWDRFDGRWKPMPPRVMDIEQVEGGYILRYNKQTSNLNHVFALDMPQGEVPSLRIWWHASNFEQGRQAAATGDLHGKWLTDLAKLGFEYPLAE